jgi:hypothetical protein
VVSRLFYMTHDFCHGSCAEIMTGFTAADLKTIINWQCIFNHR